MQNPFNNILNYINPFKSDISAPVNKTSTSANWQEDPAGFMVSVIKNQHSEYKVEIQNYIAARTAALNADRPRRKAWIELCEKAMTDGVVLTESNKRIDRVLNKEFKVIDFSSKKEDQIKTDLFNKKWFYDWMRYAMEAKIYGFSLPYFKAIQDGLIKEVDLVDRKNVIPELNGFLPDASGDKIISFLDDPFAAYSTPIGKPGKLGLMDAIIPLYIMRKHSWANWDQFEEMFGIPLRIAKTSSSDPKVKAAIVAWLRDMGSAAHALFPKDTDIDIKENKQTDAFQVFHQKLTAAKEEICLILNSQYETSSGSGSRAKAETVVASTQDETTKADLRDLYFLINDNLMPKLANIGYPINPEMDILQFNIPKDLKAELDIFQGVSNLGFELDPVQVEETFNVKILGKKEAANPFDSIDPKK
jgi:hypothetical protein